MDTMDTHFDQIDARLLDAIQREFPLSPAPFEELARMLGIGEAEVTRRLARLKSDGVIRQISAIFDSASLGYRGALVAFRVSEHKLDEVARGVSEHAGVSHCYSRDASFNLWFTITLGPDEDIGSEVSRLAELDGVEASMVLPAIRVFKIGVFFSMGDEAVPDGTHGQRRRAGARAFGADDRAAARALQRDLPLEHRPFEVLARKDGLEEQDLLLRARRFLDEGVMRRFAAVLRHTRAGYRANAMVCWRVAEDKAEEIGQILAAHQSVSHCYQRPTSADWPYPLYTMVHGRTEEALGAAIDELVGSSGVTDYLVLRTVKEYKKTRVQYFQER